jgi:hypothetical protein
MALLAVDHGGQVCAVFSPLGGDEIEDIERGLFGREVGAMADGAPEAGVLRLDRVVLLLRRGTVERSSEEFELGR